MKIKYLVLVSLILAILTIGAVSAADDSDALAVQDDAGEVISQADDIGLIADDEDDSGDDEPEDTRTEVDMYYDIPESVSTSDDYSTIDVFITNEDITGNITVKILGDEEDKVVWEEAIKPYKVERDEYGDIVYDEDDNPISTGGNSILIKDLKLEPGIYTLAVNYDGDEKYSPFNYDGELEYYFIKLNVDDEITSDGFHVYLADDATGKIELFIDGNSYWNAAAEDYDGNIYLSDLSYGNHKYKLEYTDDDKYTLEEPFEGEFNLTYPFWVYNDEDEVNLGRNVTFEVEVPYGAAELVITYNGKTITKEITEEDYEFFDNEFSVELSDFNLGENTINFTYKSDKYPEKTITKTVYVNPVFKVDSYIRYANDEDAISIILPSNATGNLVISKKGEWNESLDDYDKELIASVPLVNGKANYTLTSLGLGHYTLIVKYDGDDYAGYFDDDEFWVEIVPNVEYNRYIYVNGENTIKVILPADVNDNLTVSIQKLNDEFEIVDEKEIYNAVSNGTVSIQLPKLDVGSYSIAVSYGDAYPNYYYVEVRENAPEFELDVTFPNEITDDNQYIFIKNIPEDANGHLDVYINGKLYEDYIWVDEDSEYYLGYHKYGNHTWEIKFVGDSYYKETSKNGTFFIDWIEIPENMTIDDSIYVHLDEKEGYIEFKVDGKEYKYEVLDDGYASIPLNELSVGTHTYEINYIDTNNKKQLTKTGSFNITYEIYTNLDGEMGYYLTNEFELRIYLPEDATGKVTVNVGGKNYTATPVNGTAKINITGLVIGENNVTVSFDGDNKYPAKELKEVLEITGYGIVEKYEDGEFESVSIYLPGGNGKLVLYKAVLTDEDEWEWNIEEGSEPLFSVNLKDGFAIINASSFKIGDYNFIAKYESENDDYEIESVLIQFEILPEINITETIIAGENATISIDMGDATGKLNIYEEDDEGDLKLLKTIESANGKFQTNISGLKLGTHFIVFEYVGEDIADEFRFSRSIKVTPKNITIPDTFNSNGTGVITLELPEGYKGNVSVYEYDDDREILTPIIKNAPYTSANKTISISNLSAGYHNIEVVYTDDENGVFEQSMGVYVPKPDSSSDVIIPSNVSGDSFDVVLPKDATGSILVTIDGETTPVPLVNGTAKVDLSKLADGSHNISIKYPGDKKYEGFEKSSNITIKKQDDSKPADPKITASNLNVVYTAGTKYTVTVYGADGKVAAKTQVTFLINGKVFKTVKTNAKGIASVKITQKPGTYKITTKALGKSVVKTLKVKHVVKLQKVKVKRSAKKLVIKVTLSKVNKKYLKGKKITLKFKGKKYTAKTNKKGVVKFTIKKNVLKKLKKGKKVTYQATYLKDTVKQTVKVKK